jgi:predicted ester cyclase
MKASTFSTLLIGGLAAAGVVIACTAPAPTAAPAATAPAAPKVRAMAPADNVAWYQSCWDHFNKKNWTEFRTCYSTNAVSMQLGYGPTNVTGADAIVKGSEDFAKAAPDVHGTPVLTLAHGPHVASVYVMAGTNSGPMMGPDGKEMPATKKPFSLMFGHYIEVDAEGKVAREIGVQDSGTFLHQLGLSKDPARGLATAPASPTVVIAKGDETEAKNVQAIRQGYEAFAKHDIKGVEALETPDYLLHEMAMPADANLKANREELMALWKGFPDAHLDIKDAWGAGDYVVLTGALVATNTGDYAPMKLKKTGKAINVPMMEIDRLVNGKSVESWLFYDGMMFAMQLMPAPTTKP